MEVAPGVRERTEAGPTCQIGRVRGGGELSSSEPHLRPVLDWAPAAPTAPLPANSPPIPRSRAYLEVAGVYAAFFGAAVGLAAASLSGDLPSQSRLAWGVAGPEAFGEMATAGLAVAVVLMVCRRRGLDAAAVGFRRPRSAANASSGAALTAGLRTLAWAGLAILAGSILTAALQSGTHDLHVRGASDLVLGLAGSVNAGFLEETVALAFVVVTLEQARRPVPEIYLIAVVLRVSYHIYYGPGAVGIVVWAAAFVWLYRRGRSLWPLILLHVYWDMTSFAAKASKPAGAVMLLALILAFLVAPVTWLAERNQQVLV